MNTKSFVEKVSKAKEIQALCKYELGDWFINNEMDNYGDYKFGDIFLKKCKLNDEDYVYNFKKLFNYPIWLPTLEQLFGMISGGDTISSFWWFENWFSDMYGNKNIRGDIKEYVLDYIMQRGYGRHRKEWNFDKKDWVVIK